MDWLLDNVLGSFPKKEELREVVWPIVGMQGVLEIPKIDKSTFNWKEK